LLLAGVPPGTYLLEIARQQGVSFRKLIVH
jgi:hypothetical protein